jgi:phosphogluconate dehydratase
MPELHNLTPPLGVLLDKGFKVALVTDGRMSGASGKVPAALHLTPEAADGGPLAYVRDGDLIRLDAHKGTLEIKVARNDLMSRDRAPGRPSQPGYGRELFGLMRRAAGPADAGACTLFEAA